MTLYFLRGSLSPFHFFSSFLAHLTLKLAGKYFLKPVWMDVIVSKLPVSAMPPPPFAALCGPPNASRTACMIKRMPTAK